MTLPELIAALERATGPSRELFDEIGAFVERADPNFSRFSFDAFVEAGAYLNAALTLVPEGWTWDADASAPERGIDWRLHPPIEEEQRSVSGTHLLAPIALCIAALKARKK